MMNISKSSLRLFTTNLLNSLLSILGVTFFARELGPSSLGVFFLFQALSMAISVASDIGIAGAVEKRISEGESPGKVTSAAFLLNAVTSALSVLAILLLRDTINEFLGENLAVLLAITIVLQRLSAILVHMLKGELRVGETAELRFGRQVVWIGLGVFLVMEGYGTVGLVYGVISGSLLVCLWGWHKKSSRLELPTTNNVKSLLEYGRFNVVSSVGGLSYEWLDVFFIGVLLTPSHVGVYEVAWRVTKLTLLPVQAVSSFVIPQVSRWSSDDQMKEIADLLPSLLLPALIFVIPAFFGSIILSNDILTVIFGPEFASGGLILILLMGGRIADALYHIVGRTLQGINHPDLAALATFASVIANIFLNAILISKLGIIGAAIATVNSMLLNLLIHLKFLSEYVDVKFPSKELGWSIVSSVVMSVILAALRMNNEIESTVELVILVLLGVVLYVVFVLCNRQIRDRTLVLLESIS